MRLTTARYYTPSGRSIQEIGVTPDIIVKPARIETEKTNKRTREGDLRGALKNDNRKNFVGEEKEDPAKKSDNNIKKQSEIKGKMQIKKEPSPQDFQLQRAIDLLHGIGLFSRRIKG
jgi:carboxyl-terminal processing protease